MHRTFAGYASKCVINPRYFLVVFVCPSIRKDFALNFTDVCVGSRENPLHFEDAPDYDRILIRIPRISMQLLPDVCLDRASLISPGR